jgi:hypothetical protein
MNETPSSTSGASDDASADAQVSLGWLLSPEEFASDCAQTRQQPSFDSWAIGMDLSNQDVKLMESDLVPVGTRLALITSSKGPVYPVVVFQAGGLQVRAMMSLSDPRTQAWLKDALTSGRMRLAIQVEETAQLVVAQGRCGTRPLADVEAMIRQCVKLDRDEGLLDKLQLGERLLQPDGVASAIPEFAVQAVRLVIVVAGGAQPLKDAEDVPEGEVIH